MSQDRVRAYVDALNLYYQIAAKYDLKWIDLEKFLLELIQTRIPNAIIDKIYLFTSRISALGGSRTRQATYIDALRWRSHKIEVIYGESITITKEDKELIKVKDAPEINELIRMRREAGLPPYKVTTRLIVEKRTDMNMGCKVVEDVRLIGEVFDRVCLVTNDSDFVYPLRLLYELEHEVLLIPPVAEARAGEKTPEPSKDLSKYILNKDDIIWPIRRQLVADCMLPNKVGPYTKPETW